LQLRKELSKLLFRRKLVRARGVVLNDCAGSVDLADYVLHAIVGPFFAFVSGPAGFAGMSRAVLVPGTVSLVLAVEALVVCVVADACHRVFAGALLVMLIRLVCPATDVAYDRVPPKWAFLSVASLPKRAVLSLKRVLTADPSGSEMANVWLRLW
jgi:hypothetical protein